MKKMIAVIALATLPALVACGDEQPKAKAKAPAAQAMEAGQWQSTLEVTNFRRADEGQPKLNMPVGTRAEGAGCIGAGDTTRPPPQLFVPSDFQNCSWGDNFYMHGGRLVGSAVCNRRGVGQIEVTVNVSFTGQSYDGTVEMLTRLTSDGDVVLAARAQGRRSGAQCAPSGGAAGGNQSQTR